MSCKRCRQLVCECPFRKLAPSPTIYVNRQILEEVLARGARGAGTYRLVRTSPEDIEFTLTAPEEGPT